jgi:hypothetical protein
MSEIKYTIVIDDQQIIAAFKEHEKLADESGNKISSSYDKSTNAIDSTASALNRVNRAMMTIVDSANSLNSTFNQLADGSQKIDRAFKVFGVQGSLVENVFKSMGLNFKEFRKAYDTFNFIMTGKEIPDNSIKLTEILFGMSTACNLLVTSFDVLQRVFTFAVPIMENYGITLADILRPLEVIGIHSRVAANNLIAINQALLNFKTNPTAEGFREIEIAVKSLISQFNELQSYFLGISLSFRDIGSELRKFKADVRDVSGEIFGLEPNLSMVSASTLGYGSNILRATDFNLNFAKGLSSLKSKILPLVNEFGAQITSLINLESVYGRIQTAIDSMMKSFDSAKEIVKNVTTIFNDIKSKFLNLFSSLENAKSKIREQVESVLVFAFKAAFDVLKYTLFGWLASLPNIIIMILGAPAIIGIGAAIANAILGGFIFTWNDVLSRKFISETSGAFAGVLASLISNAKGTISAFKDVYVKMASNIFNQMTIPVFNLLNQTFGRAFAVKFMQIFGGVLASINGEITKIFTLPISIGYKISDFLVSAFYISVFKLQDLFLGLKYKWALDIKGISQLLNIFKNDVFSIFASISNAAKTSFASIDFSGIGSSLKKGLQPIISVVKFFIPEMAQEFLSLIASIESVGDAFMTLLDIMYRVFTSKTVQDGIAKISSAFDFLKVHATVALNMIQHYGSMLTNFIPQSVTDFYNLIKTIKSFDDALYVSADIMYRVFSTYGPMVKQFGLNFVQISKDIYSKVIASFVQLGSVIAANIPNSVRQVISLVGAMTNIDQIGSVAVKSFNILFSAMSESVLSKMPTIIAYFKKFYDLGMTGFVSMLVSLRSYTSGIKAFGAAVFSNFSTIISQFSGLIALTPELISLFKQMFPVISKVYSGLSGVAVGAGNWSGIMSLAIPLIAQFNGGLGQTIGLTLALAGVIGGALSYAFSQLVIGIGKAISAVSNFLVEIGINASDTFVKIKSTIDIFTAVMEGVSRSTEKAGFSAVNFTQNIALMSVRWNMSMTDIAKGTQELVLVGSQLGLTAEQIHELTNVVVQYAKINKESAYDTAVAFGSALNGNSQSVLKYGVKLSDANNQHYLFLSGQEKLFQKMSDGEKVQTRYNNILKQFGVVAGVADVAAQTLGDQTNALKSRIELLSAKFGEGSYIIENTNIFSAALVKVLGLVSDKMAFVTGFATSLFGRLGQLTGAFLQLSIKIFLTIKAFALLRILIESKFWADFANKTLPLIGMSIQTLVNTLARSEVKLNSIRGILAGFGKIGINEIKSAFVNVGIVVGNNVTIMSILSGILGRLSSGFMALFRFISPFLGIAARMAGWIGLLITAIMGLYKALKYLEDQTGLFSTIWEVLSNELSKTSGFIESIKNGFVDAFRTIASWAEKAVGIVVYSITGMITPLIYAASLLGKKFISAESYDRLKQLEFRLNGLSQSLVASGYSLTEFGKRSLASSGDLNPLIDKTKLLEDIMKLSGDLTDAGKSQLRILAETQRQRMDLLNAGLRNEVITQQRYNEIKRLIDADYFTKRKEEVTKQLQSYNEVMKVISTANFATDMAKLDYENNERIAKIKDAGLRQLKTDKEIKDALVLNETYFQDQLKKAKDEEIKLTGGLIENMKLAFEDVKFSVYELGDAINKALVQGIANSMQWVGRSLAQHSQDWKDLQKGVGNILSGLAAMFGNFFITLGMAMLATGPITGWTISAGQAIAAGMALNVLAGAFGTMGQDAPGTDMAGSPNSTASLGPDMSQMPGTPDKAQRQEPQNVLNVTINGDVLDSDESSMRIVKLINEAYDKKGVVLRQGAFA